MFRGWSSPDQLKKIIQSEFEWWYNVANLMRKVATGGEGEEGEKVNLKQGGLLRYFSNHDTQKKPRAGSSILRHC